MSRYDYRDNVVIMDIECYVNYFLVAFRDVNNPEKIKHFEMRGNDAKLDINGIKKFLRKATIVTFNGNNYDMPILLYAMKGVNCEQLHDASDVIINGNVPAWQFQKEYDCPTPAYVNHIDIFLIPKGKYSLKLYSARIGCAKLQDLPIDPYEWLSDDEMDLIAEYCNNDTANTRSLFLHKDVKPRVDLRIEISKEYTIDVRSKSDAQVGETIFKAEIERKTGNRLFKPDFAKMKRRLKYDVPDFIDFEHPTLKNLLRVIRSTTFKIGNNGYVELPPELEAINTFKINQTEYKVGIGGLHSNEKAQAYKAENGYFIRDNDVGSYYPSIIINNRYFPAHLGSVFLEIFQYFRDTRLNMKDFMDISYKKGVEWALAKYGNKKWADLEASKKTIIIETYKIVLNGCFGKLNSKFSFLFSPKMLIQVTLTGQLSLLMLIERIEQAGMRVISANTDGIVVYGKESEEHKLDKIITIWELETNFMMEKTYYKALYSQSVNSYLALKTNGSWKRKGDCAERSTGETGNNQVCVEAAMAYLEHGTPLRETIMSCDDFLKFCNIQRVTGGAYKDGVFLGKVVRWYYSTKTKTPILNAKGNTVALTQGAVGMMDLPAETPTDIDYDWYIREATNMLNELGVPIAKEAQAFGLRRNSKPIWGRKDGQQTWHLIDLSTKDALCEARLKDRHDDWVYSVAAPQGGRICGKCKKKG